MSSQTQVSTRIFSTNRHLQLVSAAGTAGCIVGIDPTAFCSRAPAHHILHMVDYEKAARRVIELYGSRLGMDKPPPMQVYFDSAGGIVPFEQVRDGSPGGMAGQVEFYDPTPGHGFYAMLFLQSEGVGRNGDQRRTYLITGPDWEIRAGTEGNKFLGSYSEDFVVERCSGGGDEFLSQFLVK